jgi:hypothetical protein
VTWWVSRLGGAWTIFGVCFLGFFFSRPRASRFPIPVECHQRLQSTNLKTYKTQKYKSARVEALSDSATGVRMVRENLRGEKEEVPENVDCGVD